MPQTLRPGSDIPGCRKNPLFSAIRGFCVSGRWPPGRTRPLPAIPAVVACYIVSGSGDFLIAAAVPDLAGYEQMLLDQILAIPDVTEARSTFAIRTVLSRGPLPLEHWR